MRKHVLTGDWVAFTLAGALLIVVLGNLALGFFSAVPPTAAHLGGPSADSVNQILLVDRARGQTGGPGTGPGVTIRPVSWGTAGSDAQGNDAALARLVRAYGYADLPLLLTLDGEGHVLRVRKP